MEDPIVIATLGNYWLKTKFTVWVDIPVDSQSITGSRYKELALEAVEDWKVALKKFTASHPEHSRLNLIEFETTEDIDNADIRIRWWYSNPSNGETRFSPHLGKINFSDVFIAKFQGPYMPSIDSPVLPNSQAPVIRNEEEIKSVVKHELGHALGLGHCSYSKDLMYTGDIRPNPRREFSKIDFEVLSQKFSVIENSSSPISTTHFIPKNSWESVE